MSFRVCVLGNFSNV